jgi:hypothetical protein
VHGRWQVIHDHVSVPVDLETSTPDDLEPVALVAEERCAVSPTDGKSLLGAHSCANARLPIMPDLTGLGSVAGTPMHSVEHMNFFQV